MGRRPRAHKSEARRQHPLQPFRPCRQGRGTDPTPVAAGAPRHHYWASLRHRTAEAAGTAGTPRRSAPRRGGAAIPEPAPAPSPPLPPPRGAAVRHFRQGDGVVAVAAAAGEREGAQEPPPPLPPLRGRALRHRHLAPLPRRQVRRDGVRCGAGALPAGVARRPAVKCGSRARRAACVGPGGGRLRGPRHGQGRPRWRAASAGKEPLGSSAGAETRSAVVNVCLPRLLRSDPPWLVGSGRLGKPVR